MQRYHQQLILFALFITIIYAETKIRSFQAYDPEKSERSHIYDTHVQLWATVVNCTTTPCECSVKIDRSNDEPQPLEFLAGRDNIGAVTISNLKANTNYSLILTCGRGQSSVNQPLLIKTDYGRPPAPQNLNASVVSEHVQITWSPPSIPENAFNYYRLEIDNKRVENISKSETSYTMSDAYEDGIRHVFQIDTCYKNNQGIEVCSDTSANYTFVILATVTPATTTTAAATVTTPTPPPTTTTTPMKMTVTTTKSFSIHTYFVSITTLILSLIFLSIELTLF